MKPYKAPTGREATFLIVGLIFYSFIYLYRYIMWTDPFTGALSILIAASSVGAIVVSWDRRISAPVVALITFGGLTAPPYLPP
jgi:hypothetical protein